MSDAKMTRDLRISRGNEKYITKYENISEKNVLETYVLR